MLALPNNLLICRRTHSVTMHPLLLGTQRNPLPSGKKSFLFFSFGGNLRPSIDWVLREKATPTRTGAFDAATTTKGSYRVASHQSCVAAASAKFSIFSPFCFMSPPHARQRSVVVFNFSLLSRLNFPSDAPPPQWI